MNLTKEQVDRIINHLCVESGTLEAIVDIAENDMVLSLSNQDHALNLKAEATAIYRELVTQQVWEDE